MISFSATILKFGSQGEKSGWTYIVVPAKVVKKLTPGVKKSYRVKGKLDDHKIEKTSLIPMGEGDFIIPINAAVRFDGELRWRLTPDGRLADTAA